MDAFIEEVQNLGLVDRTESREILLLVHSFCGDSGKLMVACVS
jgi:hypothetical protein